MFVVAVLKLKAFVFAAPGCAIPEHAFFTFPHWWEYLPTDTDAIGRCGPVFSFPSSILPVGLALIDMLLRLAGMVAVISIIIAGISYVTAAGSTDRATSARKRIINSLVGLAIVLIATAVVTFIGNSLQ